MSEIRSLKFSLMLISEDPTVFHIQIHSKLERRWLVISLSGLVSATSTKTQLLIESTVHTSG